MTDERFSRWRIPAAARDAPTGTDVKNPESGTDVPARGAPDEDRGKRHAPTGQPSSRTGKNRSKSGRSDRGPTGSASAGQAPTGDALASGQASRLDGETRPDTIAADTLGDAARAKDGKRRRRRRRKGGTATAHTQSSHAESANGGNAVLISAQRSERDAGHHTENRGPIADGSSDGQVLDTGEGRADAASRAGKEQRGGDHRPGDHRPGDHHPGATRSKSRKRRQRAKRAKTMRSGGCVGGVVASVVADANGRTGSTANIAARPVDASVAERSLAAAHAIGNDTMAASAKADADERRNAAAAPLYAALDLGTNNCRLLVASPTRPGQFRVVDAFSRIVRLGEGLAASGRLSDRAMDRAVDALKVCASKLADKPIRKARLIATEACRAAENGAEFLQRVQRETGLELEIVDRETEARLAVSGCSSLVEQGTDSVVLFDIGGGSSEIAVIDLPRERSGRLANHIRAWTSLPVGVVTLSERFGGRDVTPDTFEAMVADVEVMLSSFLAPDLPGMGGGAGGNFHLIGTSGTVTTLAGVHLGLPRYDRRRVDGLWLTSEEVDRMLDRILSWDFDQRSANPCIGADRADLVLAGCAILQGIRRRWPAERLRVADRGLREGLLTDMMAADGVWRRRRSRFPATDRNRSRFDGRSEQGRKGGEGTS
ncbi:Exopolyphosphatase [Rhizobium sp. EC-SD404]|nr:Exopolyphosphatase [Rhizobium sp. EC-SD404]